MNIREATQKILKVFGQYFMKLFHQVRHMLILEIQQEVKH